VRRGHTLTILDRDTPVARVVPIEVAGGLLQVREPARRHASPADVPLPPPLDLPVDILELLHEERQGSR
jgi:antitoxin (DNA-binding transcriptional repressor) of toxin-antitoxin stability system